MLMEIAQRESQVDRYGVVIGNDSGNPGSL
jgi:hypothetical protein